MSTDYRAHLTRGYVIALAAAAVLSLTAIFIRYLTQTFALPALVLAFWRDGMVTVTLLPILAVAGGRRRLHVDPQHWGFLVAYGVVLAAFNSLWTLSVALNGAAVSTVLAYSSAAFTALLGWWLLKEELGWAKIAAVAISLAGCALVAGAYDPQAWSANVMGILTGGLSGLCYAGYSLMGRAASQRGLDPWTVLLYIFALAAVFLLVINLTLGGIAPGAALQPADMFWLGNAVDGWVVLFMLAAGPTLLGYGLYTVSLGYLPSSVANLIVTLEPPFTAVIAYFLLGERFTLAQVGGSLMIISGVVLLRIYEGWRAGRDDAPVEPAPTA